MKTQNPTQLRMQNSPAASNPPSALDRLWLLLIVIAGLLGAVGAQAANQTWTNAPVNNFWANTNNWNAQAFPGGSNIVNSTDVAFFTNAIPLSGIGGAGNPITNDFQRSLKGLVFDTASCGAYVFGNSLNDNFLQICGTAVVTTNISITSDVTNPIVFKQAIRLVVPNSTNLRIDFTNNAVNPNASFFFTAITNSTASTRPLSLFLNGSNTGTNTIAYIDDQNAGSGAIQIFKEGTGLWILASSNDLPQKTSAGVLAGTFVEGGTLEVKDPWSLGAITGPNVVIQTNGILKVDGVTLLNGTLLNVGGLTLRNGGTLLANGTCTNNGIAIGNAGGTSVTVATTSASDSLIVTNNTGGAADTLLHISGPGTVVLDGTSSYLGKWTVDSGTLQLTNALALGNGNGANLNIAAGATFDVTPLGAVSYALATKALSASGTGNIPGTTAATIKAAPGGTVSLVAGAKDITLNFAPTSFTGDLTHPSLFVSQGTLALSGNGIIVNNVSGTPLGVGTYRVVEQASGSISSGGGYAAIVTGNGLAAGNIGVIQVSGGNLNLVVTTYTPLNLKWFGGLNGNAWDTAITANWTNGVSATVFNNADNAIFDPIGSANPTVNQTGTLVPTSITVDTSANNYTLAGSGVIAGTAGLTKISSGTLLIQSLNAYRGGTVISNGTLQVGVSNAVPNNGPGDVSVVSPGKLDLNGFDDTINALIGNGTVDNTAGTPSVLSIGFNGDAGTFSGIAQNSSGTLGLTKVGTGVETLTGANTYTGPTIVNAGILRVANTNALGSGNSPVIVNSGTLDLATNLVVDSLQGAGGTIINNSTTTTNVLIIQNISTNLSTYDGLIANGTSGRLSVYVKSGAFRMDGVQNTYSNGTIMASGTTLAIGALSGNIATSGRAGTGNVIASNAVTISLPSALSIAATMPNDIVTVDGATVTFISSSLGNFFNGAFFGSATATNVLTGNFSLGGNLDFSNFLGTVIFTNTVATRWANTTQTPGGDNTTFIMLPNATMFTRDNPAVRLGALWGSSSSSITGGGNAAGGTFWIGAKGVDSVYSGTISGTNNLVKTGTGVFTLDGGAGTNITSPDGGFTFATNLSASVANINIKGFVTVSNGVLKLVLPVVLTNSPGGDVPAPITLAGATAVLDASSMGYVSNEVDAADNVTVTNLVYYTNGVLEIAANQLLGGFGTIRGSVMARPGSVLNPGYTGVTRNTNNVFIMTNGVGTGILNVTNNVNISGTVNFRLNRTNAVNADELAAATFTINPTATVTVTNVGPPLQGGEVFHLFNHPVSGFASVTLQSITPFTWTNNLAIDGTIIVSTSTNADLIGLLITPAGALSPAFNSNILSYATTEAYSNGSITVTVTNANTSATNKVIYNGVTNIVASATASGALLLNSNPAITNVVTVQVTSQDGLTVKTYVVNVARLVNQSAVTLTNSIGGGNLTLTWPVDHTTYRLLEQTNSLAVGLAHNANNTNNWFVVPGSAATNQIIIPLVNLTNGTVFFRLIYP